jgi:hypothetical protein
LIHSLLARLSRSGLSYALILPTAIWSISRQHFRPRGTPSSIIGFSRPHGSLAKGLSLALGLAATGIHVHAARALEPTVSWCVIQHDASRDQPSCYGNLISCLVVALAHASSCTQRPSRVAAIEGAAVKQHASSVVQLRRRRANVSTRQHKLTVEKRDELFREFQQWQEQSTHE